MNLEDLQREFERFDTDENGKIDEDEFSSLLQKLGVRLSENMAHTAFMAIDVNGNGVIDFGEFCSWYEKRTR
jgi:Ca2+-binding EF-hand superfamily protein